ncbi:hormogonium polysaccharide biosynthesis protein HpsA [Scytonema sp. NUACC26]|uniref:hormogonium polysaccharide biosynthesis protein HpsA n=1 Tax=Scytonema sp. NUACC26 TaxID=3140176 RepID=UPI0034DC1233
MKRNSKLVKATKNFYQKLCSSSPSTIKEQSLWLLRAFLVTRKQSDWVNAGFVLPTVAMVALVVVLLTTAILFRSFERSKNASNVRVNETALNAASPALDRARAKLTKLFDDRRLPRATPTDVAIDGHLKSYLKEYTLGDETPLNLEYQDTSQTPAKTIEMKTAWMYPVDTDNNGKFDSYTLYGIYFKNPPVSNSKYTRARNPLEARTPPMITGEVSASCEDTVGTSALLVGSSGWLNISGQLKKSFFVYTATVPITNSSPPTGYETYKGNKGFSALEYQQDRVQLPLVNNAVVYEDDIALAPGTDFNLNGRIITNSNFITGGVGKANVRLYQVSSDESCFYDPENAKIIIGGNLGGGGFTDASDLNNGTKVDLYNGEGVNPSSSPIVKDNKSVDAVPTDIAYNSLAYVKRINRLVSAQMDNLVTSDPKEVKDGIQKEKQKLGLSSYSLEEEERLRRQQLELYFKRRTRRVPYKEVAFDKNSDNSVVFGAYASPTSNPLKGSGETLRPPDEWIYPNDPTDGTTATNYAKLTLKTNSDKLLPGATEPNKLQLVYKDKEQYLGDRVLIGNNLPQIWWDQVKDKFVGSGRFDTQDIKDKKWNDGDGVRNRRTRIEQLADLGAIERDKDWELAAAEKPDIASQDYTNGGLRVITGAGIYMPNNLTVASSATDFTAAKTATDRIWSDMMPVPSATATVGNVIDSRSDFNGFDYSTIKLPNANTSYLRMRASVVYHYAGVSGTYDKTSPTPIACVSSYYDPTNSTTAKNRDVAAIPYDKAPGGNSNNGIAYGPPTKSVTDYQAVLNYQAELKYPNGRWVNEPLKNALAKASNRTLSERSAIDSALCALQILDGSISANDSIVPHGAIKETAFLDARQIKAIHQDNTATPLVLETFTNADEGANVPSDAEYSLPLEDRQPLEIRATVLDIDLLRKKKIGSATPAQEYLVPNSGIVYATRDDALLDLSATKSAIGSNTQKEEKQKTESPVDFILDPTRRPNAIMLVNGSEILREENYRDAEKGLILASNLPVYILGNFNNHTQQEFKSPNELADDWSNFYTRVKANLNPNFACRKSDPRLPNCTTGDKWRPASILADSITLLSNNYRLGFRNEGDYDLNNNLGDAPSIKGFKQNGFLTNAYVPNASWYNASGTDIGYPKDHESSITNNQGSSYLNNFVTPIQRRANFHEYLMEVCPKLPVSECGSDDWFVDLHPTDSKNTTNRKHTWDISGGIVSKPLNTLESGSTATAAATPYQRYPRRVAFKRSSSGELVIDASGRPTPLGIDSTGTGTVQEYPYSGATYPRSVNNALWFKTTTKTDPKMDNDINKDDVNNSLLLANEPLSATKESQPRLLPVLQITRPFGTPSTQVSDKVGPSSSGTNNVHGNWLQVATVTTFNLAAAAGDTPARSTEDNGGLHNFVRFLENWNPTGTTADAVKARISGSFIQIKRSAYATGPFRALLSGEYQIVGNQSRAPFYLAPDRQWGYDVGLLSQSPDLFAQKLVRTPDELPDEYFREVSRDDVWVKTLLCAKKADGSNSYAVDSDQRSCN